MKYIINSLNFTKEHPFITLLYLLIYSSWLPISIVNQFQKTGKMQISLLGLILILIGIIFWLPLLIYLVSGVYAYIWKLFLGQGISYKSFTDNAKKYYLTIIKVGICLGLIYILFIISIYVLMAFYYDMSFSVYNKTLVANLATNISFFIYGCLFVYAFPFIYVLDNRKISVISKSVIFLINSISTSLPLITLLAISALVRGAISQITINFDYSSTMYWSIAIINNLFTYYLGIVIFLCAAQIIYDHYPQEEKLAHNSNAS